MKRTLGLVLFTSLLLTTSVLASKGSSSSSSSSNSKSSSSSSSKSSGGAVHVNGYTKKDGTVVRPYDRRHPAQPRAASMHPPALRVLTGHQQQEITSSS